MSEAAFARSIRAAARGLWTGALDYFSAWDAMYSALSRWLPEAWNAGAAEMGIRPDELTPQERQALQELVVRQTNYIDGFLTYVEEHSRARGGKLGPVLTRTRPWANRYGEAQNQAKAMAGEDQKLMWVLGESEHCSTCLKLAGKVKRASQWAAAGIRPKMPGLACGGFLCQCDFVPTDAPLSKGPLPGIP